MADALVAILTSDMVGPVNVGSGVPVTIGEVVQTVGRLIGREDLVQLGALAARANDAPMVVADPTRLRSELGWGAPLRPVGRLGRHDWVVAPAARSAGDRMKTRVAVIGAGMAGYGAAHRLEEGGAPGVIFEQRDHYGGHTASHRVEAGFTFDEGPHVSFTDDSRIRALLASNVDDAYETIHARVNNYWRGQWIKHPVQVNLHGLPADLIVRILTDFVAAQAVDASRVANYEEWLRASFGDTFAETFPMAYTRKYHTTDARNLTTDWIGPRLYLPQLEEVLAGALKIRDCTTCTTSPNSGIQPRVVS